MFVAVLASKVKVNISGFAEFEDLKAKEGLMCFAVLASKGKEDLRDFADSDASKAK